MGDSFSLDLVHYQDVAESLCIELPVVRAVAAVESTNSGFLPDGRPLILFEGHVFYKLLRSQAGLMPSKYVSIYPDIVYPKWDRSKYKGGAAEYDRLAVAKTIHEDCALQSASWGAFQVMGMNYRACGWQSIKAFVSDMEDDISNHFKAFMGYCQSFGLVEDLQVRNWRSFARKYNGSGQVDFYAKKLQAAYESFLEE